jgi:hypothetical protein
MIVLLSCKNRLLSCQRLSLLMSTRVITGSWGAYTLTHWSIQDGWTHLINHRLLLLFLGLKMMIWGYKYFITRLLRYFEIYLWQFHSASNCAIGTGKVWMHTALTFVCASITNSLSRTKWIKLVEISIGWLLNCTVSTLIIVISTQKELSEGIIGHLFTILN